MTLAPARVEQPIKSLRTLAGQGGGSLVAWAIVMFFVLPGSDLPPFWVPFMLAGLAVVSHLLSQTVGARIKPIPAGTPPAEAMAAAVATFKTSLILRFVLTEAVAIFALVLSFVVVPDTWLTYLIGGVLALILFFVNVWPSTTLISKVEQQLDREGGSSYLADALLGLTPGTAASAVIRA